MKVTPFQQIQKQLQNELSDKETLLLPKKWEKVGDVLILKLPKKLYTHSEKIGKSYADVLHCKAVLVDEEGISGIFREPIIRHIFGEMNTETIHNENGIRFHLNPQQIMFSSGNIDERKRMSTISNHSEIIVDLFAGIGYFSIPIAVYSKPKKIYACEINQIAFRYLQRNISENNVNSIVTPLSGDNKNISPKNVADRVIMGYFGDTSSFLLTALNCLKKHKGIIHYHNVFPDKQIPLIALRQIDVVCRRFNRFSHLLNVHKIKSYAPGISHYVFDVEIKG
jgi:tRNA wybutosine-synthesizing protein 2